MKKLLLLSLVLAMDCHAGVIDDLNAVAAGYGLKVVAWPYRYAPRAELVRLPNLSI